MLPREGAEINPAPRGRPSAVPLHGPPVASLDAARVPHPSRIAVVSAGILILELAFIR